jgi:hypothetical protein
MPLIALALLSYASLVAITVAVSTRASTKYLY